MDGIGVFPHVYDGAAWQKQVSDGLTIAVEYDSDDNPIYVGEAAPGTAQSATGWRIKKITWSSGNATDVTWADGPAAFTKEWDERANYSYS